MPVKLFTGLPGAGKTACLVAELIDLHDKHPERPLFYYGIDGLADGVATELTHEQLTKWWDLPPNAIIAVDEAQEEGLMPLDQGRPAEWVKRISKVRHEGMDFLLTTQHPNMLSSYVRRLVDLHVHAVRKFNTHVVQRYTWGRCMENCEKSGPQKAAVQSVGTLPAKVFDLYKSANAHNMKRRIPAKVWILVFLAVVFVGVCVAFPFVMHHLKRVASGQEHADSVKPSSSSALANRSPVDSAMRSTDYVKWLTPRVPGLPWTAPAYDHLTVRSNPRVFCIAVEDGSTHCVTEQGTDLDVPPAVAREIAAHGVYDPFLDPERDHVVSGDQSRGREQPQGEAAKPSPAAVPAPAVPSDAAGAGIGFRGVVGGLHAAYFPPESTPRNPEEILQ